MNTSSYHTLGAMTGAFSTRRYSAPLSMPAGVQSRTGLPVVSNRAFVAAWIARRDYIVAAARRPKING